MEPALGAAGDGLPELEGWHGGAQAAAATAAAGVPARRQAHRSSRPDMELLLQGCSPDSPVDSPSQAAAPSLPALLQQPVAQHITPAAVQPNPAPAPPCTAAGSVGGPPAQAGQARQGASAAQALPQHGVASSAAQAPARWLQAAAQLANTIQVHARDRQHTQRLPPAGQHGGQQGCRDVAGSHQVQQEQSSRLDALAPAGQARVAAGAAQPALPASQLPPVLLASAGMLHAATLWAAPLRQQEPLPPALTVGAVILGPWVLSAALARR